MSTVLLIKLYFFYSTGPEAKLKVGVVMCAHVFEDLRHAKDGRLEHGGRGAREDLDALLAAF